MSKLSDGTKRRIVICITVVSIVLMIVVFYLKKQYDNLGNIKTYNNNYLVYTKKSNDKGHYYKNVPYLNIKSEVAKAINENISAFLEEYLDDDNVAISYEYDLSGDILSLVIKVTDYNTNYAPEIYFKSFNYNIKDESLVSDLKLLELFNTDESFVESVIESKFQDYYNEEVEEGYFDERECDYNCFLGYREVENYLDNVTYYVKNGKLVAFKPFIFSSIYGEEEFFKDEHFKFVITK